MYLGSNDSSAHATLTLNNGIVSSGGSDYESILAVGYDTLAGPSTGTAAAVLGGPSTTSSIYLHHGGVLAGNLNLGSSPETVNLVVYANGAAGQYDAILGTHTDTGYVLFTGTSSGTYGGATTGTGVNVKADLTSLYTTSGNAGLGWATGYPVHFYPGGDGTMGYINVAGVMGSRLTTTTVLQSDAIFYFDLGTNNDQITAGSFRNGGADELTGTVNFKLGSGFALGTAYTIFAPYTAGANWVRVYE